MELHGKHLLSTAVSAEGTQTFCGVEPSTGAALAPTYTEASAAEIDRAMLAAAAAHVELRQVGTARRAAFLRAIAEQIEAQGEPLLARAAAETGLALARMTMERGRTCNQLRSFADQIEEGSWVEARIDTGQPERQPIPKPDLRRMLVPLGPVVVFGASNFPLAFSVAGGDTASAFAAGCPVVVKAHPNHPGTSEWVGRVVVAAAQSCGMPAGIFSLVHGVTPETGARLVQHPAAKAVGFTGSLAGGRALFDLAAARPEPIPVYAEMGSINPVFILPGALAGDGADQVASDLSQSVVLGVGQFCTNPGLVVTMKDASASQLLDGMRTNLAAAAAGTMLHAGIQRSYDAGLTRMREFAGVCAEAGAAGAAGAANCQAHPALSSTDAGTFLATPQLRDEVFGPSTLVVQCRDGAEMCQVAAVVGGQLTASVFGSETDFADHAALLAAIVEIAGRVVFNAYPTGVEVCPSMQHGGPYPASTDARSTSVGSAAIQRFARPVSFQGMPAALLPAALRDGNPLGLRRLVDGVDCLAGGAS